MISIKPANHEYKFVTKTNLVSAPLDVIVFKRWGRKWRRMVVSSTMRNDGWMDDDNKMNKAPTDDKMLLLLSQ